jgi:hypothetical protein
LRPAKIKKDCMKAVAELYKGKNESNEEFRTAFWVCTNLKGL